MASVHLIFGLTAASHCATAKRENEINERTVARELSLRENDGQIELAFDAANTMAWRQQSNQHELESQ